MPQALVNAWYARKAQEAANKRVKKISCGRDSIAARALNNSLVVSRSVVGGALASSGRSANQKYVLMRYPTRKLKTIITKKVVREGTSESANANTAAKTTAKSPATMIERQLTWL